MPPRDLSSASSVEKDRLETRLLKKQNMCTLTRHQKTLPLLLELLLAEELIAVSLLQEGRLTVGKLLVVLPDLFLSLGNSGLGASVGNGELGRSRG